MQFVKDASSDAGFDSYPPFRKTGRTFIKDFAKLESLFEYEPPAYTIFDTSGKSYQFLTPESFIEYEKSKYRSLQTCDMAGSTRSSVNYFMLGTFVLCPNVELLLHDILRERLEGADQPILINIRERSQQR